MIIALALAAHFVGALLTARIAYGKIYRSHMAKYVLTEGTPASRVDRARSAAHREARSCSVMISLTWPVFVPLSYLTEALSWTWKRFVVGAVRPADNEQAWELAQRKRELAKEVGSLERELGLASEAPDHPVEYISRPLGWQPETADEGRAAELAHRRLVLELADVGITHYPLPRDYREYTQGVRLLSKIRDRNGSPEGRDE